MTQNAKLREPRFGCYWFSGLSGAGKTTLATWVKMRLDLAGVRCVVLDGDELRMTLNSDLGFDRASRRENARRIAEVAKMFLESGSIVLVSTIAPYAEDRAHARSRFSTGEFFEVYVTTPFHVCKQRDPKGLYAKLARVKAARFTGHDDPYEPPIRPEFEIVTEGRSVAESGSELVAHAVTRFRGGPWCTRPATGMALPSRRTFLGSEATAISKSRSENGGNVNCAEEAIRGS